MLFFIQAFGLYYTHNPESFLFFSCFFLSLNSPLSWSPAEYQLLCGNQAPGFIIDIHTGKPIGEDAGTCRLQTQVKLVPEEEVTPLRDNLCCVFVQTSTSVERSPESVPTACVSTRSGASAASVPWASATTTYCSFAKVKENSGRRLLFCLPLRCGPGHCLAAGDNNSKGWTQGFSFGGGGVGVGWGRGAAAEIILFPVSETQTHSNTQQAS